MRNRPLLPLWLCRRQQGLGLQARFDVGDRELGEVLGDGVREALGDLWRKLRPDPPQKPGGRNQNQMFISAFASGAFESLSQLSGELRFEFVARTRAGLGAVAGAVDRALMTRRSASCNPSAAVVTFCIGMAFVIVGSALWLHQIFKLAQWLI